MPPRIQEKDLPEQIPQRQSVRESVVLPLPSTSSIAVGCDDVDSDAPPDSAVAVSGALDSDPASVSDLLSAIDDLTPVWAAELSAAREQAQRQQSNVLARRTALRDALSGAGSLTRALGSSSRYAARTPVHISGRHAPESLESTTSASETESTKDVSVHPDASPISSLADTMSTSACLALRNLTHTLHLAEFLRLAPSLISDAMTMLDRISEAAPASTGIASDLYYAHENISVCERVRDLALLDALPNLVHAGQITTIFAGTDDAREQLEHYLMANIFSAVPRYAHSDPRALVAAIRVVQRETMEDVWWQRHLAQKNLSSAGSLVRSYGKRDYEGRMNDAIVASIQRTFVKPSHVTGSVFETLSWLKTVVSQEQESRRFVIPCFPPLYDVGVLFSSEYHRCVMEVISDLFRALEKDDLDDHELVEVVKWYGEFRCSATGYTLSGGLDLTQDLNERLVSAIDRYARAKLTSRLDDVVAGDKSKIVDSKFHDVSADDYKLSSQPNMELPTRVREEPGTGVVTTNAPELLFSALGHQMRETRALGIAAVNSAVAGLVTDTLSSFTDKICSLFPKDGTTLAMADEEYVCAVANNMARSLEYTEDIRDVMLQEIEECSRGKLEEEFGNVVDRFRSAALCAIEDLAETLELEILPLCSRLYAPRTGTEVMLDIIEVVGEIFSRLENYLLPYHFERLASSCLKRIVRHYVEPFLLLSRKEVNENSVRGDHGSKPKDSFLHSERTRQAPSGLPGLKAEAILAQMDRDIGCLECFFAQKMKVYERKQLDPTMESLRGLKALLTCAPTTQGLSSAYKRTMEAFSGMSEAVPLPLGVAEALWNCRSDVKPTTLLETTSRIRALRDHDPSGSSMILSDPTDGLAVDMGAPVGLVWGGRGVTEFSSISDDEVGAG